MLVHVPEAAVLLARVPPICAHGVWPLLNHGLLVQIELTVRLPPVPSVTCMMDCKVVPAK
jgi:hypothetical protein